MNRPVPSELPSACLQELRALEDAYLSHDDPIRQSGFSGGAQRWRAEREIILDAVDRDGTFLDIGCANGCLLEYLVAWAAERSRKLVPFGLDCGERLVELARGRFSDLASHFYVANAWGWNAPRRFDFIYALSDCVPTDWFGEFVHRLRSEALEPGGTLIIGSYGSRSAGITPVDVAQVLRDCGMEVAGARLAGNPSATSIAWTRAAG